MMNAQPGWSKTFVLSPNPLYKLENMGYILLYVLPLLHIVYVFVVSCLEQVRE